MVVVVVVIGWYGDGDSDGRVVLSFPSHPLLLPSLTTGNYISNAEDSPPPLFSSSPQTPSPPSSTSPLSPPTPSPPSTVTTISSSPLSLSSPEEGRGWGWGKKGEGAGGLVEGLPKLDFVFDIACCTFVDTHICVIIIIVINCHYD